MQSPVVHLIIRQKKKKKKPYCKLQTCQSVHPNMVFLSFQQASSQKCYLFTFLLFWGNLSSYSISKNSLVCRSSAKDHIVDIFGANQPSSPPTHSQALYKIWCFLNYSYNSKSSKLYLPLYFFDEKHCSCAKKTALEKKRSSKLMD